jgi:hypothetical protein
MVRTAGDGDDILSENADLFLLLDEMVLQGGTLLRGI